MSIKLLPLEDAADAMGIPAGTLRTWVFKGYGPPSAKIGKRRMFREADVESWLNEQFNAADKAAS